MVAKELVSFSLFSCFSKVCVDSIVTFQQCPQIPIVHEMRDLKNVTQISDSVIFEIENIRLCLTLEKRKIKENVSYA